jgi:hypothetical protein
LYNLLMEFTFGDPNNSMMRPPSDYYDLYMERRFGVTLPPHLSGEAELSDAVAQDELATDSSDTAAETAVDVTESGEDEPEVSDLTFVDGPGELDASSESTVPALHRTWRERAHDGVFNTLERSNAWRKARNRYYAMHFRVTGATENIAGAMVTEYHEADKGGKALMLGALAAQGFDRSRAPIWLNIPAALAIDNKVGSALVMMGLVYSQQFAASGLWAACGRKFRSIPEAFREEMPGLVSVAEKIDSSKGAEKIITDALGPVVLGTTMNATADLLTHPDGTVRESVSKAELVSWRTGLAAAALISANVMLGEKFPDNGLVQWILEHEDSLSLFKAAFVMEAGFLGYKFIGEWRKTKKTAVNAIYPDAIEATATEAENIEGADPEPVELASAASVPAVIEDVPAVTPLEAFARNSTTL